VYNELFFPVPENPLMLLPSMLLLLLWMLLPLMLLSLLVFGIVAVHMQNVSVDAKSKDHTGSITTNDMETRLPSGIGIGIGIGIPGWRW